MSPNFCDDIPGVVFDYARAGRIGLPEAVFCENKPPAVLKSLLERFQSGSPPILFTRLAEAAFASLPAELRASYDYDPLSRTAFAATLPPKEKGSVALVGGGAADAPVLREAARTLLHLGIRHEIFDDCGIAGLWRLLERLPKIAAHDAVIAVAGMEGALATALGGMCPKPVFAVPTSVGYGVAAGGRAALSGMLASCAPGVSVLNIDNGYGAACAAARVVNIL